jgi:hypothetical protein
VAFNPSRSEWVVVSSDFYTVRATVVRADGSLGASGVVATSAAPETETLSVPRVAHDAAGGGYLVTWVRERPAPGELHDRALTVHARRLTAGAQPAGSDLSVSDRDLTEASLGAAVEAGGSSGYLVTWTALRADGSTDAVGQRVTAAGAETGAEDFSISSHTNLVGKKENGRPALAHNPARREWIVVFDDRYEIFSQRLSTSGSRLGSNARLSHMGPDGDPRYKAFGPDVAYQPGASGYLVAWHGNDRPEDEDGFSPDSIFAQHLSSTGTQRGTDDFRLTEHRYGDYLALPTIAAGPGREYLGLWVVDDGWDGGSWARRVVAPR